MAEQVQEHYEVKRYRNQFQQGRVKAMALADGDYMVSNPAAAGEVVISLLDAKKAFEAQAAADTYLSVEARREIASALNEEARIGLAQVDEKVKDALGKRLAKLEPNAPFQTDTERLARQIELQRAEARLSRLADARMGPVDVIDQADAAMLDALEQNPRLYLGGEMPRNVQEIIAARRYELASPAERAIMDKRAKLTTFGQKFATLMSHAGYEADGGGDSIRPASAWGQILR